MCNCDLNTHFRDTCWVKTTNYKNCPMIYYSSLMRIFEDYKLNNKIQNSNFDSIKDFIMNTCNFNEEEWKCLHHLYNNSNIYNKNEVLKKYNSIPLHYTPEKDYIRLYWLH